MEANGVEVEYFALTWLMTWMFHVKTADTMLSSFQQLMEKVCDEFQATILDMLCIDGVKALIKISICALKPLNENTFSLRNSYTLKIDDTESLENLILSIRN